MGLILSLLGPRNSSRSDQSATTLHNGECEAEKHSGSEGLTRNIVQDVSSDSDSDFDSEYDSELETDAEDLTKLGDGIWVHEDYLAYLVEPKDMDIICFYRGRPAFWLAIAPEWQCAVGFGSSIEEASEDLQSKLVATKLTFIEEKSKWDIKRIPIDPRRKRARKIREGWRDGCYDAAEKAYFDDYAKDSSAVEWRTIQV